MAARNSAPKKPSAANPSATKAATTKAATTKAATTKAATTKAATTKAATTKAATTKAASTKAPAKQVATTEQIATAKKVATRASAAPTKKVAPSTTRARAKPSARARGVSVEAYLEGLPPAHATIGRRLESIAAGETGSPGTIKWGQPVWEAGGPVAYLRGASRHVTFGFWRGADLADPDGKLLGDGSRMRHLRIASLGELDEALVRRLLRDAVALNARHGDPTRAS